MLDALEALLASSSRLAGIIAKLPRETQGVVWVAKFLRCRKERFLLLLAGEGLQIIACAAGVHSTASISILVNVTNLWRSQRFSLKLVLRRRASSGCERCGSKKRAQSRAPALLCLWPD
jgi:hypothetical protein